MSNHFTYEIDERNIRLQLKGYKVDTKEEDWLRFQTHSSENSGFRQGMKVADRFNITLNRNVIMPLVFGIIILAFSLLLVNFMSIKTGSKSVTVTPQTNEKISTLDVKPKTATVKTETSAQKLSSPEALATVPSAETPVNKQAESQITPVIAKEAPAENKSVQKATTQATPPSSENIAAPATHTNESTASASSDQTKAKKKRRRVESIESEESSELRPTLVSEDRDSEARPE